MKKFVTGMLSLCLLFAAAAPAFAVDEPVDVATSIILDAEYIPAEEIIEEGVVDPEGAEIPGDSGIMPCASAHSFSTKTLGNSKPSDMTLTMKDLVWQTNATFTISGTCTKPTAKLSFELYRKVDGKWVRVALRSGVSCTSNGAFEWSTSYGADGDYGLKVWHNLDADDVVKITGNLIY